MPISYVFDHQQNLVLSKAEGPLRVEDLIVHKQILLADPEFHPGMKELFDARDVVELQLTSADVWRLTNMDQQCADQLGAYCLALLVSDDLLFGMARMYQEISQQNSLLKLVQVSAFRCLAVAAAWLGVKVSDSAASTPHDALSEETL